ncbi:hypothetical protein KL930_003783 [Ogataea haglerorum]|uniref:Uncharacterized protein n=1 Tax=Ogataea haglerorum TaxID=1937702 RepID=A0ABQ7RCF6_9ASCO|nr:uncharacterized protein KL911_003922 [Ogataea haglerorum]KAG7694464.1 hypothetical protein KL915_003431 [Ogataea haglerorum]KAG7695336.1 hypothetical protein KL951_003778 [Ogataea haglerorum]KAG7705200.1 hypothetical protein KL914_003886 [Ogataea haglerorum]KAG7705457.1 hypothetical protein KL950_003893 [Ogataea haglerorum]KAG7716673.1 hypothetical protein KL913_003189 [Ogataea haglerorum]
MTYRVYACGSNGNFQLGLDDNEDRSRLQCAQFQTEEGRTTYLNVRPIKIACGGNHTLVLLENGQVFGAGSSRHGQLACFQEYLPVFRKLDLPVKVKDVVAGWNYTVFISADDEVYTCGQGFTGELGLGKTHLEALPTKIVLPDNGRIVKAGSSLHNVVIQFENGELYGFGNNKKGQLLDGPKVLWIPTKLPMHACDFALARDFAVFLSDGRPLLQGKDQHGIAERLQAVNHVDRIWAMWSSVHLLSGRQLVSYGNNSHGQLAPATTVDKPLKIAIGSEHGLLAEEFKVFAWGWGEHGNCGEHQTRKAGVTFDYMNEIYTERHAVADVFAGCATSWVVAQCSENV